jgi:hypothetical protein
MKEPKTRPLFLFNHRWFGILSISLSPKKSPRNNCPELRRIRLLDLPVDLPVNRQNRSPHSRLVFQADTISTDESTTQFTALGIAFHSTNRPIQRATIFQTIYSGFIAAFQSLPTVQSTSHPINQLSAPMNQPSSGPSTQPSSRPSGQPTIAPPGLFSSLPTNHNSLRK